MTVHVPWPDPVTVTGEVSAPAPGEVRIEVRVTGPGADGPHDGDGSAAGRHVAATSGDADPAAAGEAPGLLERVARHRSTATP
ncbi:hypothetical protein AB2L27_03515 [Kineococcus sp. LSe6-4]|uniref:Uncharacterized protein n=1 Tax=Kineococcus halophytocola TaxID=3234027 RepID=A0ABV4GZG5_9ACTN